VKLKDLLAARRGSRRRRPRADAPREIIPRATDPFDAARERLKAQIPPRREDQ
jgi:hypothetical protein